MRRPVAVAITGGIGAGKSELLHAFERPGAAVISSDEIVHTLLREDADVKRAVVERLGSEVLGSDGEIDREAVGRTVFADPSALRWLEELLHPLVVATYLRWRERSTEFADPARRLRDRGAAPLRSRRRDSLRQGRRGDGRAGGAHRDAACTSRLDAKDASSRTKRSSAAPTSHS